MLPTLSTHLPDSAEIFETYHDRIYRYVLGLIRNSAEADDLTQETFLRAIRQLASLRDTGALVAWLYRIATHVCLDRLRQRARLTPQESETDLDDIDLSDPDAPSLQKSIEQNEMSTCVQNYLADLPDSYRAVILLHDLHGLTGPEIAEMLDVSLATVKIRLHRARHRLQTALRAGCAFSHDERNILVCESKH